MADQPPAGAGELAAMLKRLRKDAGLSSPRAAVAARRSQSWISHRENGRVMPTVADIELLADLYGAPASVRRRLIAHVRDLREDANQPARLVMRRAGDMQQRIGRIEASSRRIATFSANILPGLLQTEDYMRMVFASGDDLPPDQQTEAVAGRLDRAKLLREPGREFVFVVTEGPLRWRMGDASLMAAQLDHVVETSRLPGVRVGVIPWTTPVRVAPMHGFDLHDRRAAIVGIESATAFLTNPHDVAMYVKLFADLEASASFGDTARAVIAALAGGYRSIR